MDLNFGVVQAPCGAGGFACQRIRTIMPIGVGEMLVEEFMEPLGPTQGALAEAMGVHRKHANELCNGRRAVTAATALILARVFGNRPEFRLNVQRRTDLWETMHSPGERERFRRTRLLPVRSSCMSRLLLTIT